MLRSGLDRNRSRLLSELGGFLVTRPGSRVHVYEETMVKRNDECETWKNGWEANKIGRRVCDIIADGDVLVRSLGSLERSIVSGPRVINTLSSGTEGHGKVRTAFPDPCS
jgi:hypothetical protein